jgi:hypothetical protein
LVLNQALYDKKNVQREPSKNHLLLNQDTADASAAREWRRKHEIASLKISDLEVENLRMTEEFMKTTNEKEARLKESLFCNA